MNRQLAAKSPKYRNISQKLQMRSRPNLRTKLRRTISLYGSLNITQIKSNMAAGRHLENGCDVITPK